MSKKTNYLEDRTWLNEIMEKNIVIIGLSLSESEIFIRHVLIQRHLYNIRNNKKLKGYYLTKNNSDEKSSQKKEFFLNCVGIDIISCSKYDDVYK